MHVCVCVVMEMLTDMFFQTLMIQVRLFPGQSKSVAEIHYFVHP